MRVILMRHGRAGNPDPDQWPNDLDRPLTQGGVKRLKKAARGLAQAGKPDRVYASKATRTRQTARVMEEDGGWPAAKPAGFLADGVEPKDVTKKMNKLHERGVQHVALVGHEPQLSALASYWLTGEPFNNGSSLKKGAAASIDYHPQPGGSHLEWMMPAKALARMKKVSSFTENGIAIST